MNLKGVPIAVTQHEEIMLPNYSGIRDAAKKGSAATLLQSGDSHTLLADIGTNTHALIDTHITDDVIKTAANVQAVSVGGDATGTIASIQIDHVNIASIGTNTHAQIDTAVTASTNHIADTSDPHGVVLTQANIDSSGTFSGSKVVITGDQSSADTVYVANVLYNTDAVPPTASTVPIGTLYIQYTA